MRSNQKIPASEYARIEKYRLAGEALQTIANRYGVSRERIRQIIKEHFPEIKAKQIVCLRQQATDKQREGETVLCECGCGTLIPKWRRGSRGEWVRAAYYLPDHVYHHVHERSYEIAEKLTKFLKEHPEGVRVPMIMRGTGLSHPTVYRYIREPKYRKYIKLNVHRIRGPHNPYIVSLAEEETCEVL